MHQRGRCKLYVVLDQSQRSRHGRMFSNVLSSKPQVLLEKLQGGRWRTEGQQSMPRFTPKAVVGFQPKMAKLGGVGGHRRLCLRGDGSRVEACHGTRKVAPSQRSFGTVSFFHRTGQETVLQVGSGEGKANGGVEGGRGPFCSVGGRDCSPSSCSCGDSLRFRSRRRHLHTKVVRTEEERDAALLGRQ